MILTFLFLSREIKSTSKESYKTSLIKLIKDGIYFRLLFNYQSVLKHPGIQLHGMHSTTANRTAWNGLQLYLLL